MIAAIEINLNFFVDRFLLARCSARAGGELCAGGAVLLHDVVAGDPVGVAQGADRAVLSGGAELGAVRGHEEAYFLVRVPGHDRADFVALVGQGVSHF